MKFPIRLPLVLVPFVLALAVQMQAADPAPGDDHGKAKGNREYEQRRTPEEN